MSEWARDSVFWLAEHQLKRLPALFAHYNLDPKENEAAWQILVLRLAEDHIPGFQQAGKRGAPARGEPMPDSVPEIERMVHASGLTVSGASKRLAVRLGRPSEGIRRDYSRYQQRLRAALAPIGRKPNPEFKAIVEKVLADVRSAGQWDMHFIAREMLRLME